MASSRADVEALEALIIANQISLEAARVACPDIKIWVITWNLGAAEPFEKARGKAPRHLEKFVPPGYDLYVVGVQEAASDDVFDAFEQRLNMMVDGISRLDLAGHGHRWDNNSGDFTGNSDAANGSSSIGSSGDADSSGRRNDYIYGRGDGSILHPKFTGLAVYARDSLVACGRIKILKVATCATAVLTSKGGAACCLSLDGQSVALVSCHLEAANKFEERRAQYRELSFGLGSKLGEDDVDLAQCVHHIIWVGDMNYRCVQGTGRGERDKAMDVERCVKLLESGQAAHLFAHHDQLSVEIGRREVFYEYQEPQMAPDFYPTYKKFEQRPPCNYLDMGWVRKTYHVAYREPIYKGGRVKERTPGWCDRVLFHSLQDLRDELVPEQVPIAQMPTSAGWSAQVTKGPLIDHATGDILDRDSVTGDHYYAVNDGYGVTVSDHSPVVAGFVFQAKAKRRDAASAAAAASTAAPAGSDAVVASKPPAEPPLEAAAAAGAGEDGGVRADVGGSGSGSGASARGGSHPPSHAHAIAHARACAAVRLESLELMVGTDAATPAGLKILFPMPWEAQSAAHAKARAEVTVESEIAIARRLHGEGMKASESGSRHSSSEGTVGGAKGSASSPSPPASHPSPMSSYSMTNRFKSSAASAVGSGLSSLRRKQNSSSPPLPPAVPHAVPHAVPPASLTGAAAGARGSETSQSAPETMDVAWQCKPSVTGGVCAEFTFPDPSMYDLLTVGGVTSGNTSNSSSSESPRLPWLQMEYEGPRTLDELHCNIQVKLLDGSFGTVIVNLSQLAAASPAGHDHSSTNKATPEAEETEASSSSSSSVERPSRATPTSMRFVQPLMFRGLPLTVLAGGDNGDEPEVVTAVFTLSLREPSRDEGPDENASLGSPNEDNSTPPKLPPRPQSTPLSSSRSVTSAVPLAPPGTDDTSIVGAQEL